MVKNAEEPDAKLFAAFDRGLAESLRRNAGEFDGLMGSFQGEHSELLRDICLYLRNYLLDRCAEDDVRGLVRLKRPPEWNDSPEELARELLVDYLPREGFHWVTPVPDDVELALGLVNMIASVFRVDPEYRDRLIYGEAGTRDKKSQVGRRKGAPEGGEARRIKAWEEWGERCVKEASNMLAIGYARHELAGILARKYGKSPQTVRALLKKHLT